MTEQRGRPGRPLKGAGGTQVRRAYTVDAAPSIADLLRSSARQRGMSAADCFEALVLLVPVLTLYEREARRRGIPVAQLLEEGAAEFPRTTII